MKPNEVLEKKEGLINLVDAADYLGCSHQWLYKMLKGEPEKHPLRRHFRHYAGAWRTTYAMLDEYFSIQGDDTHAYKKSPEE